MTKIFLIGYMGVGKTTIGRKLAGALGLPFADLDRFVENENRSTVAEIFATEGEARFREMERNALLRFTNTPAGAEYAQGFVLATGGGTPCYGDNMDLMRAAGITVWLQAPAGAIASRLAAAKVQRPLLRGQTPDTLQQFVADHLAAREPFYARAQHTFSAIDTTPERIALLAAELKNYSR